MSQDVVKNPALHRYELTQDGSTAVLEYSESDGRIVLTHTEVPEALGGRGIGSILAREALEDLRASGLKIAVQCEFVASFIDRHKEYQDLVHQA